MSAVCPTPKKRSYLSKKAAFAGAATSGVALNPYLCQCGNWHLTMRTTVTEQYDEVEVQRILSLPVDDFVRLAFDETRHAVAPETAAALRAPSVIYRWGDALKVVLNSVQESLRAARGGPTDKRGQLARREQLVRTRLMEVKDLKREQNDVRLFESKANQERTKRRQGTAATAAINRLIELHLDEYRALLDEERQKLPSPPADSAEWME
ncbi:hypothetical protein [Streptomyces sp. NPDC048445]|uniref:hypothetical protein n=1 Tax=Streptomyces sp. NPDC048445 TaxID=3365553 RepID=UPI00371FEF42